MKVAIINMTNGGISGGYKKYLLNILPRLASHNHIKSLLCISPASLRVDNWFKPMQKVEFLNCPAFSFLRFGFDRDLRQRLKRFSPDLIYIPVARYFEFSGVPVLNMVQNIFPFLGKDLEGVSFSEKLRLGVQHFESRKALKHAKRIIVTSNFIKDFLVEKLGIPAGKISLIYFGRDPLVENIRKPACIPSGLEKKFLFTAGSLEPYRGIEDIIGAARYLKEDLADLKIVIAGQARAATKNYYRRIMGLTRTYSLEQNIIWAGQLTQGELAWCYQNCAVFIATSRMETFGMVALEALSNGCLCIVAQNPPLPEIFLDCADYYAPKDLRFLADAVKKVLNLNNQKKQEMADKAKKRAEYFSWDKSAADLIKEFKATIEC